MNGVLRTVGRNLDKIAYPPKTDAAAWMSVAYSMPEWIVRQWLEVYDRETVETMLRDFLVEKPTYIRCNLMKTSPEALIRKLEGEGVKVRVSGQLAYALMISGYDYLNALESFRDGEFQVQDISSMMVGEWAAPGEGDYVIDVCAAPGGKALHLAEKMRDTGKVEARDLTDHKVELIRENIERSGLHNIEAFRWDASERDPGSVGKADIVVADLPCSGLGVLGKKPDLKYKMTAKTQRELTGLQRRILSVVKDYVKPGGMLLYSTCTVHRAENEENAEWFLKKNPEFILVREQQMLPGRDEGDGFYIAAFRKERLNERE